MGSHLITNPRSSSSRGLPPPLVVDSPHEIRCERFHLLQLVAHLYFILLGVWLWCRWGFLHLFRSGSLDCNAERKHLVGHMSFYVALLHRWGIIETEFVGFEEVSSWSGSVLVANHPSILDAVLIMTRVPSLDLLINARLLRHPVMGGAIRPCHYLRNDAPLSMIKSCRQRLASGSNILIFPEGTRTETPPLGEFHHGYALASTCAKAPIRTIFLQCDSDYFGPGFFFFKPARCPIRFRLTMGRVFEPEPNVDPMELSAMVEAYFRANLGSIPKAHHPPPA